MISIQEDYQEWLNSRTMGGLHSRTPDGCHVRNNMEPQTGLARARSHQDTPESPRANVHHDATSGTDPEGLHTGGGLYGHGFGGATTTTLHGRDHGHYGYPHMTPTATTVQQVYKSWLEDSPYHEHYKGAPLHVGGDLAEQLVNNTLLHHQDGPVHYRIVQQAIHIIGIPPLALCSTMTSSIRSAMESSMESTHGSTPPHQKNTIPQRTTFP